MRKLTVDGNNPAHVIGPYLLFARSNPSFSDYHDFEDWGFLGKTLAGKMWGHNAVIAAFSSPSDFAKAGGLPDWIEFIEIASIGPDWGIAPFSRPAFEFEEGTNDTIWNPSSVNLTSEIRIAGNPEKICFDQRILIVSYGEGTEARRSKQGDRLRSALGKTSLPVWHSADLHGIAFKDQRSPEEIMKSISGAMDEEVVYDAAVFRIASALTEPGVPSPLGHFLMRQRQ